MNSIPAGIGVHRLTKTQGTSTSETHFKFDGSGCEWKSGASDYTKVSVLFFSRTGKNFQYLT
jgi:hypothetical protein